MSRSRREEARVGEPTHAELVDAAVRWARGTMRCTLVVAELTTWRRDVVGSPDVFASHPTQGTLVIECKRSRSDFRADAAKRWHQDGTVPGERRVYLTTPGLVSLEEVPDDWGLAEFHRRRVRVLRAPPRVSLTPETTEVERAFLLALAARFARCEGFEADRGRFVPVEHEVPQTLPVSRDRRRVHEYGRLRAANRHVAALVEAFQATDGHGQLSGELRDAIERVRRLLASRGGSPRGSLVEQIKRDPECRDLRYFEFGW